MTALGYLIEAISLGVLYALIAVSVGLVFGVLRQVNLAQGEVIAFGAYSLWMLSGLPAALQIVLCFAICIASSLVLQLVVFRPLRGASPLTTLIVTFGVSYGLEALWQIIYGPNGNPVTVLSMLNTTAIGGAIALRWITLVEIGAGAVLFSGLYLILFRSGLGVKMRAAAEDVATARLVGVRVQRVVTWAFVLSGVSAAVVAVLSTVQTPLITPNFGLTLLIVALVGVVLGGIDNLGRATAGGFIIGFVNSLLGSVLPEQSLVFLPSLTFLFVIIALLARPNGLLMPRRAGVERV
ncbi:MAG TPA: branched-chain amino acid ABC transporter permease [Acidimicrobiales bacterium]|nr:branched-chain amino acid ABC transporter permease [Acidimicrobiales bacterium]